MDSQKTLFAIFRAGRNCFDYVDLCTEDIGKAQLRGKDFQLDNENHKYLEMVYKEKGFYKNVIIYDDWIEGK